MSLRSTSILTMFTAVLLLAGVPAASQEAGKEKSAKKDGVSQKILLDKPGLASFKRANPWVAELESLPSTQIYVAGERVKSFFGGGMARLESRLQRVAGGAA